MVAMAPSKDLTRFAWLSVAAALVTIALKMGAWLMTGSVGLLADAAESVVNLVAAIVALIALRVAARPADHNHHFGHTKAEYFSAAVEGAMILVAAVAIIWAAIDRLMSPQPVSDVGVGLVIAAVAGIVNGVVATVLIRAGKRHNSIALRADGRHLMTDVYTSIGVIIGVALVGVTGWGWLDAVVALAVGVNIIVAGYRLIAESTAGLMDHAMSEPDNERIKELLRENTSDGIEFHAVRTRESGSQQFMEMHMLVPGAWTVKRGHDEMEDVIEVVTAEYPHLSVTGHLEPLEDPRSYEHT